MADLDFHLSRWIPQIRIWKSQPIRPNGTIRQYPGLQGLYNINLIWHSDITFTDTYYKFEIWQVERKTSYCPSSFMALLFFFVLVYTHKASTATRLRMLGHGSPKFVTDIATAHVSFPLHLFSKTVWEFEEWQAPCLKFPHAPNGVPKLANFIAEMDWPGAHFRCTLGLYTICLSSLSSSTFQFLTIGCHSDTSKHIVDTDLFFRLIFLASPPNSSNTTNKFLVGCNHDLGRWYLRMIKIM